MALTVDHFKDLVTSETKRLNQLCDQWVHVMDTEPHITEEGFGQIRSTIGKTHLLIDQRFKQFSGLISDCALKRGLKETKVEDLQGFWEMVYFQVLDLNQAFDHLNQLKDNQWREPDFEPEPKPAIKRKTKVVPKVTNKPVVRSKIREQIMNMKNKNSEETKTRNESFGEKENKKIEDLGQQTHPVVVPKKTDKTCEKSSEGVVGVRNVLKRTPLVNAVKK